ncbi:hypothetical protein QP027_04315 [Corynebacterium breve]|uniref:Uncharacterized protein n=2 Tax=Corynebacterium breve TaxID=3049799 RepID=A0ABY8VI49_9CORY|nr:hypothetical protein [Corynebacterium breve]WIM69012.1 hypothetical protein QP027_04315 [Corynebacterium breve]
MGSDKARVKLNGRRLVDIMLDSLDPGTPRVVVSPFSSGSSRHNAVGERRSAVRGPCGWYRGRGFSFEHRFRRSAIR